MTADPVRQKLPIGIQTFAKLREEGCYYVDKTAHLLRLFAGLCIHDRWDWSVRFPVVRISFGAGVLRSRADLDLRIRALMRDNQRDLGIACNPGWEENPTDCFGELLRRPTSATASARWCWWTSTTSRSSTTLTSPRWRGRCARACATSIR